MDTLWVTRCWLFVFSRQAYEKSLEFLKEGIELRFRCERREFCLERPNLREGVAGQEGRPLELLEVGREIPEEVPDVLPEDGERCLGYGRGERLREERESLLPPREVAGIIPEEGEGPTQGGDVARKGSGAEEREDRGDFREESIRIGAEGGERGGGLSEGLGIERLEFRKGVLHLPPEVCGAGTEIRGSEGAECRDGIGVVGKSRKVRGDATPMFLCAQGVLCNALRDLPLPRIARPEEGVRSILEGVNVLPMRHAFTLLQEPFKFRWDRGALEREGEEVRAQPGGEDIADEGGARGRCGSGAGAGRRGGMERDARPRREFRSRIGGVGGREERGKPHAEKHEEKPLQCALAGEGEHAGRKNTGNG